jgi:hypothetical protein
VELERILQNVHTREPFLCAESFGNHVHADDRAVKEQARRVRRDAPHITALQRCRRLFVRIAHAHERMRFVPGREKVRGDRHAWSETVASCRPARIRADEHRKEENTEERASFRLTGSAHAPVLLNVGGRRTGFVPNALSLHRSLL